MAMKDPDTKMWGKVFRGRAQNEQKQRVPKGGDFEDYKAGQEGWSLGYIK